MTTLRAFVARHPATFYFVLAFGLSWGSVVLVVGPRGFPGTTEQFERLLPYAGLAMLAGPGVAGLLLTGLFQGKAGFRRLLTRMTKWRVGVGWYAVALLTAPLVTLAVLLSLSLASPAFLPAVFTSDGHATPVLFGLVAALVTGFCEELGWTGFAVPALRRRYGVLGTGLAVGVLWGAWHFLTNALWASGTSLGAGELSLALFLTLRAADLVLGLAAFRVLMTWVYDRTGSLLVAVLMHASLTATTLVLGPAPVSGAELLTYDVVSAVATWVVVAAVVVAAGGHLSPNAPRRRPARA